MKQPSAHRIQQMLAALRYFAATAVPRSMNMGPRRLTWGTITCLRDAGLIEPAEGGASLQDSRFSATEVGRQLLKRADPKAALISAVETAIPPKLHQSPPEEDASQPARSLGPIVSMVPRLGLNRVELAASVGVAADLIDEMVRDGFLPGPRRWKEREVWIPEEVSAFLIRWPDGEGTPSSRRRPRPRRDQATEARITLPASALLNTQDVCEILSIDRSTLYRLELRGQFPKGIKLGQQKRWRVADVETFLAEAALDGR